MERLILKSQKKQIFEEITRRHLEPAMFEWGTIKSGFGTDNVSILKYTNTNFFFIFDFLSGKYYCRYSPGQNRPFVDEYAKQWETLMAHLTFWLQSLSQEVNITDPWEDLDKYLPGGDIHLEDEKENTPFTFQQVEHITQALSRLASEMSTSYKLDSDQNELVQQKLDYLIDRSKTLGRIDWKNIFVATLMSIAVNLAFNPQEVRVLWELTKTCFQGILFLQ